MEVRIAGKLLPPVHGRSGLWLLALLILRHPRPLERDWLTGVLWPESTQEQALANLRQRLSQLRRALGAEGTRLLTPTSRTLSLDLEGADVDLLAFDAAMQRGDPAALEQAHALYRGPLLEGCTEEWVHLERHAREQSYLTALETMAAHAISSGDAGAAVRRLQRIVELDMLRESAHRSLMEALAARGDYAAVSNAYRDLRMHLHAELNAEPAAETTALFTHLRRQGQERTQSPPARSAPPIPPLPTNPPQRLLPRPLTELIGWKQESAEIVARLSVDTLPLTWRIELLGGLRAYRGREMITDFGTRKANSLLAYLVLNPHHPHPRAMLAEKLWPDETYEATRDRLRQALAALRRVLEPSEIPSGSLLIADRAEISLAPERISTDVADWKTALHAAERATRPTEQIDLLRIATHLYQGELLPGYQEGWIPAARDRFIEAQMAALRRLATLLLAEGEVAAAIDCAQRAVDCDPLHEEAQCDLIRLYGDAGQPANAIRQHEELVRVLRERLNLTPSPAVHALITQIRTEAGRPGKPAPPPVVPPSLPASDQKTLSPTGGLPLDSPFYIERPVDREFSDAITQRDSIVLVKGPRQVGKTSLLARGLEQARRAGAHVVQTDLQALAAAQLESADVFFFTLAEKIADQLNLDVCVDTFWNPNRLWNVNFDRFLRKEVLGRIDGHIVWGLDEVDRLFGHPFSTEVFGLFRSWHNQRSLNPIGPWARLTLAIAYATEAHLFITDLNQSPFNVGTRLVLDDFTLEEMADLNRRYGSPLVPGDLERFAALVGGNPYLVHRGLHAIDKQGLGMNAFVTLAEQEDGLYSDPLRRMVAALRRDDALAAAARALLRGDPCPGEESFYRLRSAGVITGRSARDARFRCRLYQDFIERYLA
jgi:DNA-binding SARP family transcriptional activator